MRTASGGVLLSIAMMVAWDGSLQAKGEADLSIKERIVRADSTMNQGANLFDAYRLLRGADPLEVAKAPSGTRGQYYWALGRIAKELGRYDQLDEVSRRFLELFEETRYAPYEVYGLFSEAVAREGASRLLQKPAILAAMRRVTERADPGSPIFFIATLAMGKMTTGEESRRYLREALKTAEALRSEDYVFMARSEIARLTSRTDPALGLSLFHEAGAALSPRPEDSPLTDGWEAGLEIMWRSLPREEAFDYSTDLLERVESWRLRQEERGTGSMGFFSHWIRAYRRVMGYILLTEDEIPRGDLEEAFQLSERMRARVLLDRLRDEGMAGVACADEESVARRKQLRQEIVALQRDIAEPGVDEDRLRWRIEVLLLEEEAVDRDARCPVPPSNGEVFARLADVERGLAPDEAMLVFNVNEWEDIRGAFDGGAWVFVITRRGSAVHRLPSRTSIHLKLDALTGALRRRDDSEADIAAALYDDLLMDVVPGLPEEVEHLILVPHGPTHGLPMAVLRPSPGSRPLIERYVFSYVPSATIWMNWRRQETGVRRHALAFANPMLGVPFSGKLWSRARSEALGPLPMASHEGRALVESLGGRGRSLEGEDASEKAVKDEVPSGNGIMLFAAHAIVDERLPKLSSIVLAPGGPAEDGLLQPPEISVLDLRGNLVILSACQSAGGTAIEGEGLLSLARAFFQAGSTVVVGNLWPALDDEAAALFSRAYRNLASGHSVAEAFQRAQRESMLRGDPAEAWAGVMVLGLGSARLEDSPDGQWVPPLSAAWLLPLGAVLLWGLLSLRRYAA